MTKHIIVYQPNASGEIEKIETINGIVVENTSYESGFEAGARAVYNFFFGGTQSAKSAANKKPTETYDDGNGRVYNPDTGNMEYTAERGGGNNPFESGYIAPQDYQGSVPVCD